MHMIEGGAGRSFCTALAMGADVLPATENLAADLPR
jgi:hypothetical protein